jgi:hypothetical protein
MEATRRRNFNTTKGFLQLPLEAIKKTAQSWRV